MFCSFTDHCNPFAESHFCTAGREFAAWLPVTESPLLTTAPVQHRLISSGKIDYFNSPDHDTTLTNVAAGRGVCLAPGFLNDHSGQFAWIPFDCKESFTCVLCTHKEDRRDSLNVFIDILKKLYAEAVAFPL